MQDPLEEVDLEDGGIKRPTYISTKVKDNLKKYVAELLNEFKDFFAWDYDEMSGLSRGMVEYCLLIQLKKKPVKQQSRRFIPEIMSKIKQEVERSLNSKFIKTTKYVEWLANIVPVIKNE